MANIPLVMSATEWATAHLLAIFLVPVSSDRGCVPNQVHCGLNARRSILAVAGDGAADESWIAGARLLLTQAHPIQRAGEEVLDDHVDLFHHSQPNVPCLERFYLINRRPVVRQNDRAIWDARACEKSRILIPDNGSDIH